ncbi:hypothetical protein AWH62_13985 [Maricaulis sp. W15]|uniref:hypothetical protein n=1 Tax=Maricaulis sp. W15 TaxID=1772333 RepID=UPI000948A446|nr:hypothetical protein [Maricaulis sp. W15]OLF80827.1 hypothetical protein AWH62_13985 [Maricaulis sp. W15]
MSGALLPLALAFLVSLATAGLVLRLGILDHPNARSNHVNPTPRGGGLGIVLGFLVALFFIPVAAPHDLAALTGLALCTVLAAGLGFLDDLVTLSERLKFVCLALISLALAGMAGPVTELGLALPWLVGWLGSALFVFTLANTVNFMDGSDGLMTAALIPAALTLAWLAPGATGLAALALAAALAGFAVWNAPLMAARGKLFSGDVGSLGAAVILAGLALMWASNGPATSVWLVPLLVLPLLGDVLLTMAARVKAGASPFVAHRSHAYQLLIAMGASHRKVAVIWGAMSLVCGALALLAAGLPPIAAPFVLLVAVLVFAVLHQRWRRLARAAGVETRQ